MTDAINTQNRLRHTGVSNDTRAGSTAKTAKQADSKSAGNAGQDASIVDLSNSTLIQELEEQIKNLPEINQVRINSIKQSLSNGEYVPDAEVIALKFSEIEKLLP